jgi:alpha-tubulin suppressor-like RCC1 family protein
MICLKKTFLACLFSGLILGNNTANAQADLFISGGNTVSSMVATNGKAYVWGNNRAMVGTSNQIGILGLTGAFSSSPNVTTPTEVTFPVTIEIQQISSGSGNHFLALDCEGGLWAWGNNTYGQVGNGTTGNIVTAPVRVRLGALATESASFDPTSTGFITKGVKIVYSGQNNSFAILEDGRLISWGYNSGGADQFTNSSGMLGDGTTINRLTPVFVKSGITNIDQKNGEPLRRVTQIYVGDNVAYALVDNPFGIGIGTVYSFGYGFNGVLGRNATGTGNPSSTAIVQDSYARPVCYADGSPMENIVSISAGDVFGIALDRDGYVWTWGNGGWNNATGSTVQNYIGSDPRRVIAGTTTGASNDGSFLLAKSIGGGQGFGMAVTVDGKPVAWGGSGTCDGGGITGTGNTTAAIPPTYIKTIGMIVHNDVVSIARGDMFGFYQRLDGSVYAWGCNNYGQLGNGNINNNVLALPFTPPVGAEFKDVRPSVKLTPIVFETCASQLANNPVELNNGFEVSTTNAAKYRVRWFKNNNEVAGSPFNATTGKKYSTNSVGTYKVTIEYVGTKSGCKPYPIAEASTTISAFKQNFDTYSNLGFCANAGVAIVSTTNPNSPIFKWYNSRTSTTVLATTVGNNNSFIDLSTVPVIDRTKTVYVEEASPSSGVLFKKTQACDTSWSFYDNLSTSSGGTNYQMGISTFEKNVTLSSLSIRLESQVFVPNGTLAATLNFGIFASKIDFNGNTIADETKLLHSFEYNFSKTNTTSSSSIRNSDIIKVPFNFTLPAAGVYFIGLKKTALTNFTGSGTLNIGRYACSQTLPVQGIPEGIIAFTNTSFVFQLPNSSNYSNFFNIEFSTAQAFCDRIPVTLLQDCPCSKPSLVSLASSTPVPKGTPKTISVCTGTGTLATLVGTFSNTPANDNYYSIYKKGSTPIYTKGNTIAPKTLVAADSGTWILRVEDGASMKSTCYAEDTVVFVVKPKTHTTCIVTGDESESLNNVTRISPNPFNDYFMLETTNMEKVIVLDQRGILFEEKSVANVKNIQLGQSWPAGLYMLQLSGNGAVKTIKVIKEQ